MAERALLMFVNTHATMEAADVLGNAGIARRVVPRPLSLATGCGIAMELPADALPEALAVLGSAGARPTAICAPDPQDAEKWVMRADTTMLQGEDTMSETLDCRGMSCPLPILETKKRLDALAGGALSVLVDHEAQAQNIRRAVAGAGYSAEIAEAEGHFVVNIARSA